MTEKYKKLDSITHIHKRQDMYIGTNKTRSIPNEIICSKEKENYIMKIKENAKGNDGFVRIYLEALSGKLELVLIYLLNKPMYLNFFPHHLQK